MLASVITLLSCLVITGWSQGNYPPDGLGGYFQWSDADEVCYVAPDDTRLLALPAYWYNNDAGPGAYSYAFVDYEDTNGGNQADDSANDITPTTQTTSTFSFPGVPVSSISDKAVVTEVATIYNYRNSITQISASFTLSKAATIITTDSTSVIPSLSVASPTTDIVGLVSTTTTLTSTQSTTVSDVTGTRTIHAPTPKTTVTTTIKPKPYTCTEYKVDTTTTSASCIPHHGYSKRLQPRVVNVLKEVVHVERDLLNEFIHMVKRAFLEERGGTVLPASAYITPSCGPYNPSFVYTNTVLSTSVSTTTPAVIVPATTTITTTTTTTSTAYKNVKTTTTVTPHTHTITSTKYAWPSKVKVTKTITVTKTVYKKYAPWCTQRHYRR